MCFWPVPVKRHQSLVEWRAILARLGSLTLQARSNIVNEELAHSCRDSDARVAISQTVGTLPVMTYVGILPRGSNVVPRGNVEQQFTAVSCIVGLYDVEQGRDVVVADLVAARDVGSLQVGHHVEIGGENALVEEAHPVETHPLDGVAPELKASADAQHALDLGHVPGRESKVHVLAIFHVRRADHDELHRC